MILVKAVFYAQSLIIIRSSETCLVDVKKMEPIDGLNRINKVCAVVWFIIYYIANNILCQIISCPYIEATIL